MISIKAYIIEVILLRVRAVINIIKGEAFRFTNYYNRIRRI